MARVVHFMDLYDKKGERIQRLPYEGSPAAHLHLSDCVDFVNTIEAVKLDSGDIHHVEKTLDFYTRDQFNWDLATRKDFLKQIGFAGENK